MTRQSPQIDTVNSEISQIDKSRFNQAPNIEGISGYINVTPEELEILMENKVILYDFWTYSCINCIRTLPHINAWDDKYSDDGLLIIGIHAPEFEFEKDINNVRAAVDKYGIKYPVIQDNDKETWKNFENRYWPRKYIADHEGFIRYDHIGEGAYKETEKVIQDLLKERSDALNINMDADDELVDVEEFKHTRNRTPELYLGYEFARNNQIGNPEGFVPNSIVSYNEPPRIEVDRFYMVGDWYNHGDYMELKSETGKIILKYVAKEVNIVAENESELKILVDGRIINDIAGADIDNGMISTDLPDLYNIIDGDSSEEHTLEIFVDTPGFRIFTFTFG